MNTERYTDKVKQILQAAQSDALLRGHAQLTPWHILAQALGDSAGLAENLISAAGGDAARSWLAEKGYDPVYGARPLKRVIQREVQDGLAEEILSGALGEDAYVLVDITVDQISLTASEKKAALN